MDPIQAAQELIVQTTQDLVRKGFFDGDRG